MDRNVYDVIVVGAGPGGATLAAKLGQAGFSVLLLEKAQMPRYKVCGGGVTKRALLKMPVDITPVIQQSIDTLELAHQAGSRVVFKHKRPFVYCVMREELDYFLARHAVACGVELKTGTFVQKVVEKKDYVMVTTKEEVFTSRYLVGADGVNSLVARQVGLMKRRRKALALECEIEPEESRLESYGGRVFIDYGLVKDGYAWLFPKKGHWSIGVGSYSLDYPELFVLLQCFIASGNFQGRVLCAMGSFLSAGGEQERIMTSRVALLGDAAGLVDPFAGEGIYYALWSAELLAVRLQECLSGKAQAFSCYQSDVDRLILPELQTLARLGNFFYSHTTQLAFLVQRFPQLAGVVCEAFEGRRNYQSLVKIIQKLAGLPQKRHYLRIPARLQDVISRQ